MRCAICNRELNAPASIAAGIGPECAARYQAGAAAAGSSVEWIERIEAAGNQAAVRWVQLAKRAIGAGRVRDARQFLAAAEALDQAPEALAA